MLFLNSTIGLTPSKASMRLTVTNVVFESSDPNQYAVNIEINSNKCCF